MLLHTWLPATLRNAGIKVVETSGWTSRSHGALPDKIKVVWHHDASPPGDSPGALNWMISNWNTASAQVWIDNYGTWHLVGTGKAWHAGTVKPGMPGNNDSIGIETDQTTGEAWPAAQLNSLRAGTAAIFKKQSVGTDWLHFHKTICDPTGRKSDPAGLDLGPERNAVASVMGGSKPPTTTTPPPPTSTTPPPPTGDWFDMATKADLQAAVKAELNAYFASGEGNPTSGRIVQACNTSINGRTPALVDAVWDEVMPDNASGGSPETNVKGSSARRTLAGLMSGVNRIYKK